MECVGIVKDIENNNKGRTREFILLLDSVAFTCSGSFIFINEQYISYDYDFLSCLSFTDSLDIFNLRAINEDTTIYRIIE